MTTHAIRNLHTGTIDITFYRQQAEQARAAAIHAGFRALGRWLKAKLHVERPIVAHYRLGH